MPTTISESPSVVTLIDVFEATPHEQADLVELLERSAVEVMQYLDGFISASVHRGLDGKHVALYAQWARREDLEAMLAHSKVEEQMRAARTLGRSTSALYSVDSVLEK